MTHRHYFLSLLLLLTAAAGAQTAADTYTQGLRYKVTWATNPPTLEWDGEHAPEQLTVTAPGLGYATDETGEARLILDWREGRTDLVDRDYSGTSFFAWGLEQVSAGQPIDRRSLDQRRRRGLEADGHPAAPSWTGTRTVRLSNPGHEMVFEITPDGATATDNGEPLELTGGEGNYRAFGKDFEVGVSVRADGYVYHYYKPK